LEAIVLYLSQGRFHFTLLRLVQELPLCLWLSDDTFFHLDAREQQDDHHCEDMHDSTLAQKIAAASLTFGLVLVSV
jgi:hypothetical protein